MNSRSIVPLRPYAVLVTAGMSLLVLTKFIVMATDVWALRIFGNAEANPLFTPVAETFDHEVSRISRWVQFADVADLLFFFYTAVVFAVFFRHAYRNIMQPVIANRRYSPGWTTGAFLIPVVNFVLPYLVMRETWQCSRALIRSHPDGYWQEEERPLILRFWWPTTLMGFFLLDLSERIVHYIPRIGTPAVSAWLHLAGIAVYLLAVAITLVLIWKLTGMQWKLLVNARREESLKGR